MREAILLIGPTGSGKTPLGEALEARGLWDRACRHFDFGRQLRHVAAGAEVARNLSPEDVRFVRSVLQEGALLEDSDFHIAERLLEGFLAESEPAVAPCSDSRLPRIVLNGLPRHIGQARRIDQRLAVRTVVRLDCPAEVVLKRIASNAGGDRSGRTDDDVAAVRARIDLFERRTAPLVEHYRNRGAAVLTVAIAWATTAEDARRELDRRSPEL